jgi:hypothetical protein
MCVQGCCSVCSGYAVLFGAFASCPKHAGTVSCFDGSGGMFWWECGCVQPYGPYGRLTSTPFTVGLLKRGL